MTRRSGKVSIVGSAAGASVAGGPVPVKTAIPSSVDAGLIVRVVPPLSVTVSSLPAGPVSGANAGRGTVETGQVTTTLGTATLVLTVPLNNNCEFVIRNVSAAAVELGASTVTFGAGFPLAAAGTVGDSLAIRVIGVSGSSVLVYAIDNGVAAATVAFFLVKA